MRAYINEVWNMFGNYFMEHAIKVVPRSENMIVDSLAVTVGIFKTPMAEKRENKIHVRDKPSIPDNSKDWQVFKYDDKIKRFLELLDEFANTQIDNDNFCLENI